jgi:hypothetical protein
MNARREDSKPGDLVHSACREGAARRPRVPKAAGPDGRYRVAEELGSGGLGVVHKAHDLRLDRDVALKFLSPGGPEDQALLDAAVAEARAAARLNHPGIAQIHDVVVEGPGSPFLVCELGPPRTLADLVAEEGPLRPPAAAGLLRRLVPGLEHAHAQGIVHGDLKPSNVLVADDGSVKLIDFGMSALARDRVRHGGSPGYSPQESFSFDRLTPAADVFALGALTWNLLTGSLPTTIVLDRLPAPIGRVVARALQDRPADRFPSAAAFLEALEAAASRPESARPATAEGFIPHELFLGCLHALEQASRTSGHGLIRPEELELLRERFERLEAGRQDLLRVVVWGEFKAGKSTLVNALAGRRVAATDVLEMTCCVSEFYPSRREGTCRVRGSDGASTAMPLEEFLALCARRELGKRFPAGVSRVEIGIGAGLPFVLVDTPGMGSTSRAHEASAVRALSDADLLLWTLDINALGAVRDFVVVEEARRLGLPIWAALAQCDTAPDPGARREVMEWVSQEFGLPRDRIFPTAALSAVRAQERGAPAPAESGIPGLLEALSSGIQRRGAEIRREAQRAQCAQLAADLGREIRAADGEIEKHERTVRRLEVELRAIAAAVQASAEAALLEAVERRFLAGHAEALRADLSARLRKSPALPAPEVEAAVRRALPESYLEEFWGRELRDVTALLEDRWQRESRDAAPRISQAFRLERGALLANVEGFVASGKLSEIVLHQVGGGFEEKAKTGLALAAVATAYTAWLGPGAAAISLGSALTGVGLPLALLGLGAAYLLSRSDGREAEARAEARASEIVEGLRRQFREGIVKAHLVPQVAKLNDLVVGGILDDYCRSTYGGFDLGEVRAVRELLRSYAAKIESLKIEA